MKLIPLCTLFLGHFAQATELVQSRLLRCLASEEADLHRQKSSGPQYKLNQLFFNEWSGNPELELQDEIYAVVCKSLSPSSVLLLREFMLKGRRIFKTISGGDEQQRLMKKITLDELRRQMPQVFFNYVAEIEVYAPTANCLNVQIPKLAKLREQYRYLEAEVSLEFLDQNQKDWDDVFAAVLNWRTHFKKCQVPQKVKASK